MVLARRQIVSPHALVPLDVNDSREGSRVRAELNSQPQLTSHAATVFSELSSEADKSFKRVTDLAERTRALQDSLVPTRDYFKQENILEKMNSTKRVSFWPEYEQQSIALNRESMPESMQEALAQCENPPQLDILDQFSGGSAMTKYSHPGFFMEAFVKDQEKEMEEMLQERKRRKKEKMAAKRASRLAANQAFATPIQRINKAQFDPTTGKRIEVRQQDAPHRKNFEALFSDGEVEAENSEEEEDIKVLTKSDLNRARTREPNARRPSDSPMRESRRERHAPQPSPSPSSSPAPASPVPATPPARPPPMRPPPSMFDSDLGEAPPLPPVSVPADDLFVMPAPAPPPLDDDFIPPPVKRAASVSVKRSSSPTLSPLPIEDDDIGAPMPPSLPTRPDFGPPPAPPLLPPPISSSGGPPPPPPPMPVDFNKPLPSSVEPRALPTLERPAMPDAGTAAVSDLLADIRTGFALKKVDTSSSPQDKKLGLFAGNTVEAILKRRAAIAGSDSSDDEFDDDDEWDDEYSL